MPVPIGILERLLLRAGIIPPPAVDLIQHAGLRLLLAGHRLGVFDALEREPLTVSALATTLHLHPRGLEPLLDLLQRQGYLAQHAGRYALTGASRRWLTARSPQSLQEIVGFLDDFLQRWDTLEETIRRGEPPRNAYDWLNAHPDRWPAFHDGQRTIASFSAAEMAARVRLPARPLRLLDLGGSHGLYTTALCQRYPLLEAVIYDWPQGVAAAEREIARNGMQGRISTLTGDFFHDSLGDGYDVVLLGNIIHGQRPPAITLLLQRVHTALQEDGRLLIVDQVRMRQTFTPLAGYAAALAGFLLLNELGGGLYPFAEIRDWLHASGFHAVRRQRLWRTPGFVLVQSVRRATTIPAPGPARR